jgi:RND family efflux transporter MFP subunit
VNPELLVILGALSDIIVRTPRFCAILRQLHRRNDMHKSKTLRVLSLAVLLCGLGSALFAADASPAPSLSTAPKLYAGIAKPFVERTISYERPGRILVMHVKVGDLVKKGDLLAELNAEEEKWALKIDESKAHSEVSINAERAVRRQKQGELDRMKEVGKGAVSPSELRQAEVDVVVADARIDLAIQQHEEDALKVKQDAAAVAKAKLTAPIDGVVAQLFIQEGETAEGGKLEAMRIIQNDPLLVEVPVPVAKAVKLKLNAVATVQFPPDENGPDVRQGKITEIADFADIGSQLVLVKVQVANPKKTLSGMKVDVDFSSPDRVAQK